MPDDDLKQYLADPADIARELDPEIRREKREKVRENKEFVAAVADIQAAEAPRAVEPSERVEHVDPKTVAPGTAPLAIPAEKIEVPIEIAPRRDFATQPKLNPPMTPEEAKLEAERLKAEEAVEPHAASEKKSTAAEAMALDAKAQEKKSNAVPKLAGLADMRAGFGKPAAEGVIAPIAPGPAKPKALEQVAALPGPWVAGAKPKLITGRVAPVKAKAAMPPVTPISAIEVSAGPSREKKERALRSAVAAALAVFVVVLGAVLWVKLRGEEVSGRDSAPMLPPPMAPSLSSTTMVPLATSETAPVPDAPLVTASSSSAIAAVPGSDASSPAPKGPKPDGTTIHAPVQVKHVVPDVPTATSVPEPPRPPIPATAPVSPAVAPSPPIAPSPSSDRPND